MFWENVLFNSHVACYVTCFCRKAFKQPFTDVLQNRCSWKFRNIRRKEPGLKPRFDKVSGLKACVFIWKETPTLVFFSEYCKIFKNSVFIEDLFILPFQNFYLMIDNWYFRVIFYYCKVRPHNRKNSAIDQSKLVFHYLIVSFSQIFVSTSNCKEKLVALNWKKLVSNFRKYIWSRSSCLEVFCWKGVFKKFTKFIEKKQYQSLFFE